MTEKRYYIGNGKNCTICDSKKGGSDFFNMLTQFQAVDRLNELAEEKEYYQIKSGKCEEELLKLRRDNEQLIQENKELKDKNNQLQETLAFRSNQLALMERLVDDLGSEEMARQMEEILE